MKHPQKRLIKFSALEAKGKQFYQPTLMPTSLHFVGGGGGGGGRGLGG